jgi:hypothetical protein
MRFIVESVKSLAGKVNSDVCGVEVVFEFLREVFYEAGVKG